MLTTPLRDSLSYLPQTLLLFALLFLTENVRCDVVFLPSVLVASGPRASAFLVGSISNMSLTISTVSPSNITGSLPPASCVPSSPSQWTVSQEQMGKDCAPELLGLFVDQCLPGPFGGIISPVPDYVCSAQSALNAPDWFPFLCVTSPLENNPFLGLFYDGTVVVPKPAPSFQPKQVSARVPPTNYRLLDYMNFSGCLSGSVMDPRLFKSLFSKAYPQ